MRFDLFIFQAGQLAGLVKDLLWNADLANVVEQRRLTQLFQAFRRKVQFLRNSGRIVRHFGGVTQHIGIARVDHLGNGDEQVVVQLSNRAAGVEHFAVRERQFFIQTMQFVDAVLGTIDVLLLRVMDHRHRNGEHQQSENSHVNVGIDNPHEETHQRQGDIEKRGPLKLLAPHIQNACSTRQAHRNADQSGLDKVISARRDRRDAGQGHKVVQTQRNLERAKDDQRNQTGENMRRPIERRLVPGDLSITHIVRQHNPQTYRQQTDDARDENRGESDRDRDGERTVAEESNLVEFRQDGEDAQNAHAG